MNPRSTACSISPVRGDYREPEPDVLALLLRVAGVRAAAAVASGKIPAVDYDDIKQETAIALWLSLRNYDPSRASIRTFLERVASWRFPALLRRYRYHVIVDPLKGHHCATADPIPAVEVHVDCERIVARLEGVDREIAELLFEYGPTEISQTLGLARSTFYKRQARLQRAFRMNGYEGGNLRRRPGRVFSQSCTGALDMSREGTP